MTYHAYIVEHPYSMVAMLYVQREAHVGGRRGSEVLSEHGDWVFVEEGTIADGTVEIGIRIPIGAVQAVAEAFHPYAGHGVEVTRLEQALDRAESRVDKVLEAYLAAKA